MDRESGKAVGKPGAERSDFREATELLVNQTVFSIGDSVLAGFWSIGSRFPSIRWSNPRRFPSCEKAPGVYPGQSADQRRSYKDHQGNRWKSRIN